MEQRISGNPTLEYVAGFASYLALLALDQYMPFGPAARFGLRFFLVLMILVVVSRHVIAWRSAQPVASVLLGIGVFFLWVGPDYLFPHYRSYWLFTNSITGSAHSSIDPALKSNTILIVFRVLSSVITVPILEELFWRGWLMRWLVDKDFLKIPIGKFNAFSFWVVALLFASEHGAYWDVGLATGIIYNWWAVRTRNLADCMLAHAVTNGCLAIYVLKADQWQYWL
jgi:CAAX prenyl protease-like protein